MHFVSDKEIHEIKQGIKNIMSAISDFTTKIKADFATIAQGIKLLDDKIVALQNSLGSLSVEDQKALDEIQAQSESLAAAANAFPPTADVTIQQAHSAEFQETQVGHDTTWPNLKPEPGKQTAGQVGQQAEKQVPSHEQARQETTPILDAKRAKDDSEKSKLGSTQSTGTPQYPKKDK